MKRYCIVLFLCCCQAVSFAQKNTSPKEDREAYVKVITERAGKIVAKMDLADTVKAAKVTVIIRDQYSNLNDIYDERNANIKEIKSKNEGDKVAIENALKEQNVEVDKKLNKLHKKYLAKLSKQLSDEQIEQVKNGMTYNVMPNTYQAYQDELLNLTEAQKKQIYTWLVEAREHAIDAESSDKKHAWFGKYKGKINNFLSAEGYDLKKEGIEWEKRRKASAQNK
ncbi:DUF3826 domain-containing protein [Pedobacter sp. MC2016-14]|uniref:DUF3826 domain-containing protein n=1 Tax=Pedobacter sp. MC2016-14 TaxID=2897327 RepID=UPI001E5645FC|nr:DUF3826 domain-containing protein [Pedobacter sp. MC2016-14]MCD0489338.1 DUF3826 domain-containing protein [Pedobacter sp. MC2016-14]